MTDFDVTIIKTVLEHQKDYIEDVVVINKGVSNGDVIMTMFPNVNVYEHNGGATYSVNNEYNFNATWWNAPYQKGGK